jgi:succinate dehydrogenase/fumarate reductase flavoprotein subunit
MADQEDPSGEATQTRALPLGRISDWDMEHDVVIVGHGGAGACAAIEAVRAGADTLVLEKQTRGGGSSAVSTGVVYFGGGTRVQKACGFEDSVEEMIKFVRKAAGRHADEEKVRLYCENSVEHFDWLVDLGVDFKDNYVAGKTTHPFDDSCLFYSGNEQVFPFVDDTVPAPRGHKVAQEGEAGGYFMEPLLKATEEVGANILTECGAERAIVDPDGRIVGVVARKHGKLLNIKARRGVILCAGGFIDNKEMVTKHAADLLIGNWNCSDGFDDGSGILLGAGAGGELRNMHEGLALNAYYPPDGHLKGILVDRNGHRFINEDAYLGRTTDAMIFKADGQAYLIVDDELFGQTQAFHKLAAVEETFEELEKSLDMPAGELVHTIEVYNRNAGDGKDPLFHKAEGYCRPLSTPPYAAIDCTAAGCIYGMLTLGGLATAPTGEVLTQDGQKIVGLYAAGRNTAGLCLEGRTYASGMSLGDVTFFGRVAGRVAAGAEPWD